MRLLGIYVAAFAAFAVCSAQSGNVTTPQIDFSIIPACGLVCLATTAPKSGCTLTDVDCICNSQKMTDLTTVCVLANCTTAEAFTLLKAQADICQYGNASRRDELRQTSLVFGIMTKFIITIRVSLRLISQGKLGWDDWLIILAMASDSTAFYALLKLLSMDFGAHIWNINPADIPDILFWFYIVLIFYVVTNGIVKISILAFYLRIFSVSTKFATLCWINIVFCAALMICFVNVIVFQCTPLSNAWKLAPVGYCVNFNAATWSYSGLNVLQDIIVIVLPVMEVIALQMSPRKKFGVVMIFVLGGFVIVASTVRLTTLPGFGRTSDPTWTNAPTAMWSAIELGVGLACASIPGIYSGLRHVWPNFRNFTRRHISMRGTKPTEDSSDYHTRSKSSISGIPPRAKYHKASLDLLTTETFEMQTRTSLDKVVTDIEAQRPRSPPNLNKPYPSLPHGHALEQSSSIEIVRGPRS